jgi:hypothetical protein
MDLNHAPTSSFTDASLCGRCQFPVVKHGTDAECDSCNNKGVLQIVGKLLLCRECLAKEIENSLPSVPVADLTPSTPLTNTVLQMSREVDNSIRVSSDLFNAATTPIMELKKAIDLDDSIPQDKKTYKLAEELLQRFNIHKRAIFDMQEKIVAEHSSQRAIQQYLNNMASSLQAEEREKLKLADINYKPEVVKDTKVKVKAPKAEKFSNAEVKAVCKQFGVDEFMVRMTITAQGCSLLEAVHRITLAKQAANKTGTTTVNNPVNNAPVPVSEVPAVEPVKTATYSGGLVMCRCATIGEAACPVHGISAQLDRTQME